MKKKMTRPSFILMELNLCSWMHNYLDPDRYNAYLRKINALLWIEVITEPFLRCGSGMLLSLVPLTRALFVDTRVLCGSYLPKFS